ncbi:MAG: hypothetical protein IJH34_04935 [Romboutsia sp.]|nr:AP2 domain-containing protein [Bacilli bacterium]MBQ3421005.1 hypothetical protein [Romboutsia sp.]
MRNTKDLTGSKIGKLMILDRKIENNNIFYYCKCDCGNKKWIRSENLTKKQPTLSCGCLSKETCFRAKDITNNRYGRLVAIKSTFIKSKVNGAIIWECKCDCGDIVYVTLSDLQRGVKSSCGCLKQEQLKLNGKKVGQAHIDKHIVADTNLQIIRSNKPTKNNTSGHKGISWDNERKKWKAIIHFKKKRYYLGRYDKKEDAIKARQEAEERFFKPIIDEYKYL